MEASAGTKEAGQETRLTVDLSRRYYRTGSVVRFVNYIVALFWDPVPAVVNRHGDIYIADYENSRVRVVTANTGIVITVAGSGACATGMLNVSVCQGGFGGDGGPAKNAILNHAEAVALDADGNLYIADTINHRIRRIDASTGLIYTIAGNGVNGYSGDGGPAVSAEISFPVGIAVDRSGESLLRRREQQSHPGADSGSSTIAPVPPESAIAKAPARRVSVNELGWSKRGRACRVLLLCVTTAIGLPAQILTTLVSFDGPDGINGGGPWGLVSGNRRELLRDNFPGRALRQRRWHGLQIHTSGYADDTVYLFCSLAGCPDSSQPYAGLIQGSDGNFYGTTVGRGSRGHRPGLRFQDHASGHTDDAV